MELKNVSRYYPETPKYGNGVQYFRSEDGLDFYDSLDKFTKKYKLCIEPATGVICSISEEASRLYPVGFSVVDTDELPDGCDISGKWRFVDGVVSPVPVDYHKKAESQRQNLLDDANDTTADWRTELSLGIISDEDKACLVKWMTYIKALKVLDLSDVKDEAGFKAIKWPDKPEKPLTKQE
ncbi:phage tail protein [Salmonella enterica]|uniref:Tail fiber assembly protein n=1 Tax=Salmonella enterica TaxID=28901 RepID=A0A5V0Q320_SALER|nr:tail fiber assembly protein [Salmonella enterica]EAC2149225.1 phage tail protein [Salmonella enterica subsp. enterica]EAM4335512.1 phage tail protein [Salmonella enterica subsp. enterica serovar Minnesota]EAN3289288.1 phage tail protein [Salmonella enterica subsp. enterica serovar Oranienburg]EAP4122311.1 phage tail protein [Salmonella enterica subsp. enterica serovar Infantis]EAR0340967.1 phage tail protein [Salmonella enterica subsp. enterica serovar Anatum]EAR0377620.1 phage tail protei